MTSVTQTSQSGGDAVANIGATLSYDASGNLTRLTRSLDGQAAVSTNYNYDSQTAISPVWSTRKAATTLPPTPIRTQMLGSPGFSRLFRPIPNPQSPIPSCRFGRLFKPIPIPNPQSLLTSATTPDGTAQYTYDADGELTGATYGGSQPDESYSYDANGNRTNPGYVTGADNELLSDRTYNYSYDADGNRIERMDIATGAVTDYVWDNRDRLVEVIDRASAGGAITQDVHYFYDAQNRWIGESISIPGQAVQDTNFAYNANQIVLQFDGTTTSPLPLGE